MRTKNVKISMEIPVPIDNIDENGVKYTSKSFEDACKDAVNKPIEIINDDGTSTVVGVASEVKYINDDITGDYISIKGILFDGGTNEEVKIDKGTITNVKLSSFGITK